MISVVIPAYKNPSEVRRLVESLARQSRTDVRYEVVVVDDGSQDPRFEDLTAVEPWVRLLRLPVNAGAAAARNAGARAATFDILLFMDSDMQALTDLIAIVAEAFRDPGITAMVGAVDHRPANPTSFTRFWGLVKAFSLPQGRYSSTFYPMVGAIRKDVFLRIGGFEERIKGASIEDYEISMRLRAAGVRVHYNPRLLVRTGYHPMWKSLRQSFSRSGKWMLLFAEDRQFHNHTTTPSQAAGMVAGACLFASACLVLISQLWLPVFALFLTVYGVLNRRFYAYVARHAGAAFVPRALVMHVLLSLVVCAGVARASRFLLQTRERRLLEVYRA